MDKGEISVRIVWGSGIDKRVEEVGYAADEIVIALPLNVINNFNNMG